MTELHTLMTDIAFGEQPRWHEDRLWFSDWGPPEVIAVDLEGNSEVILQAPSFPMLRRLAAGRAPARRLGARGASPASGA